MAFIVDWQIADDLASVLEHPAIFPRCHIGQQGCNAATSAALLPTKDVAKQPAAAETKPAWRLTADDRDYRQCKRPCVRRLNRAVRRPLNIFP